ncbi:hypothetical protein Gorai_004510 [Gossypium raimondii]|uniref:Uncharacterized protein n=1 Tax=Gossypium raimondii TaxID=29730 RepID=A0A7J8QJ84_GOSRA|nr:hypothetical protein [Gossypium raimondii]
MIPFPNCLIFDARIRWLQIFPKGDHRDDVHFHRWDDFCLLPKQPTIIPLVLEFYSNLKFATHDRGDDNEGEAESAKGNEEVMEADDEASKGHEAMTRNETIEDVATSTGPMSRGKDLVEQSTPLRQTKMKKTTPQ